MKKLVLISLAFVILSSFGLVFFNKSEKSDIPDEEYKLVWSDEFDYTGLPDHAKWDYDHEGNDAGWGNKESQYYTRKNKDNAWVEDGKLKITAQNISYKDKEFTSARLMSKVDWKYGRIEVNAKLPDARGTWSAIWAMPGGWSFNDGNWPDVGEIDIMEHVGHNLGVVHASAHSKDYQWQKDTQKTGVINVPDVNTKFHTYILDWTPDYMKGYVDDSLYFFYENEGLGESKWPYDKPFYLIMNVAVGGAWGNVQGIDTLAFPQTMEVDYVRVYQK
jgi:beta-glucanase (GH16 family)